jgi:hypothetical protein
MLVQRFFATILYSFIAGFIEMLNASPSVALVKLRSVVTVRSLNNIAAHGTEN